MSLHMAAEMARLTVLGTGWGNTSFDSGPGFTIDGELWREIAIDLDYDFGDDTDWDLIAEQAPEIEWPDIVFETPDGTLFYDLDGDGIWVDPISGLEYPGGGTMWVPEDIMIDVSTGLTDLAIHDASLARYNIPNDVIPSLYGGKVSTEITQTSTGSDRPHYYTPPVWYIQRSYSDGIIFLDEPFFHGTAEGGSIIVYDEAITIRDGSSKAIYWSSCTTHFTDSYLPSPYSGYPIQYVCWQCMFGSLNDNLISKKSTTVPTEDIESGDNNLEKKVIDGKTYYAVGK